MANKTIIAKLAVGLFADTGELKKGLQEAKAEVTSASRVMTKSAREIESEIKAVNKSYAHSAKVVKLEMADMKKAATEAKAMQILFKHSMQESEQAANKLTPALGKLTASSKTVALSFKQMGVALAAAVGVSSITASLKLADQYNVLTQRIKTATKETGDFKSVSEQLISISAKNGASLKETVSLFQNIARTRTELGATNKDILAMTNTIQQLGVIGGSSSEDMGHALKQLSQAMAGGTVRAEEFNSIIEGMPELAHRIAVGLGMTDAELRKNMLSGNLLAKDVLVALKRVAPEVAKEFAAMPKSMGQAFQALTDKAGIALSKIDSVTGGTRLAVAAMDVLAVSIEKVGNAIEKLPTQKVQGLHGQTNLGNAARAGAQGNFGLDFRKYGNTAEAMVGLLNPNRTMQNVLDRYRRKEAERKGRYFGAMYGLDDPAFDKLSAEMDGITEKKVTYPKKVDTSGDEKAAAKAKKKHDAELKHSEQILANMRSQNEQLRAKLGHDDEALTKEKALLQVSKDKTLTEKEKVRLSTEINKLAAEHAALIKQQKIGEEKEKLAGILSTLKEKSIELRNQLSGQKEMNVLSQAEKDIQDAVKEGKKETVAEQQKIRDTAKEIAALEEQIQRQKVDKRIREDDQKFAEKIQKEKDSMDRIGQSLREQNEQLILKLNGQEELSKAVELERDFQRELAELKREEAEAIRDVQNTEEYTADDKQKQIEKVKSGYRELNAEAQKRMAAAREDAQTNIAVTKALSEQEKVIENIKNSTGSYKQKLAELDKALSSNQITSKQWQKTADELWKTQLKTNDTFGSAVKQIGNNFTQAILNGQKLTDVVKQLGKSLAALALQKLVFEPAANLIDNTAAKLFGTGKYTQRPTMPGMGGGQIASGGGLGNLFGGGPKWGGPENATNEILANEYERLYDSGRDALGAPLQDLEYYYQLPRAEAARRLGIAGVDVSGRRPSSGGMLGGLARSLGIPAFANGGMARGGQMALVGEQGPELIVPAQDLQVYTSGQTRSMLSQMSGGASERLFGNHTLNTGGSAFTHGVSAGGGSLFNSLSGGGSITPEEYLGDWVPEGRRNLLSSIGFSSAGARVLSLMKAIREEKNNYNKKALNDELTNALHFREQEWQGLLGEYRELAAAANRAGAQKMVNEETAAGRGEGLAAMAGNAILSNNHISHGIIAQGRLVAPRGNAVEDALAAGKLIGRMPSEGLLKHLAALDAEASADYMPGNFIRPSSDYKSLGMGFAGQGGKVFGYDDAYGGDGRQAAIGDLMNDLRDSKWATDAATRYWGSMNNTNPLGSYKGASAEYLANVKGWNKFPKNYAGPGANSSITGDGFDLAGSGLALTNGGRITPTGATGADPNGWNDDPYDDGTPNPKPYDPTANPGEIGTVKNFKKMAEGITQRFNEALKKTGLGGMLQGLKNSAGQIIGPGSKAALDAFNSLVRAGGSGAKELAGDLKSSLGSWNKGDFALNMGGLRGDLKSSAGSWAYKGKGLKTGGLAGDLKDSLSSWLPKPAPYNGLFGTGPLFGDGDLKGLAAYSGPMLYPAMGIAMPPSIKAMTGRPPAAPQPFRGSLSPYADADYRYNFTRQYNDRYSTVGNSAFGRWQTDPFTAGRINARMVKSRANGGPLAAGDVSWVGERGPELIVPNKPSYVVPNHALSGKPELKVIVNNNVANAEITTRQTPEGLMFYVAEKVAQQAVDNTLGGVRRKR